MYAIYSDNNLIYSANAVQQEYKVTSPVLTTEVNKAGSLTFDIPPTNPNYSKLLKMKSIITVEEDGEEIWRGRVLDDTKNWYNVKTVMCEGELAFLNDAGNVPPYDYSEGIKFREYYNWLLSFYTNHCSSYRKITAGTITAADPDMIIKVKSEDYSDVMTELSDKIVGNIGGYLKIRRGADTGYLDYLDSLDTVSDQSIIFGRNLLDLSEYTNAADVYTYMIPLGKKDENGKRVDITSVNDGKNYIYSEVGEATFGKIIKPIAWDDTTDPATLKKNAEALMESVIKMATTIEINAIDLKLLGVDTTRLHVSEFVPVMSPAHGIASNFLCSKIDLNLMEPERSVYTFGLVFSALTDKQVLDSKQSANAYQTAKDTSDAYNALRTEIYENYVSSAAFESFQSEVNGKFEQIGVFNPETYLTVDEAKTIYETIENVKALEERVKKLEEAEQGGSA